MIRIQNSGSENGDVDISSIHEKIKELEDQIAQLRLEVSKYEIE